MSIAERTSFEIEAMLRPLDGQPAPPTPSWFEGSIANGHFTLHRLIAYRNSFLPYLFGSIVSGPSGTELRVFARPHWFTTIFTAVWLAMASGIAAGARASFREQPIVLGMLAFGIALYFGGFVPEAIKARRLLARLLAPGPAPDTGAT